MSILTENMPAMKRVCSGSPRYTQIPLHTTSLGPDGENTLHQPGPRGCAVFHGLLPALSDLVYERRWPAILLQVVQNGIRSTNIN